MDDLPAPQRTDPLDMLFTSGDADNYYKTRLADFLEPKLRIDAEFHDVRFLQEFTIEKRVILYLLVLQVLYWRNLRKSPVAWPKEIEERLSLVGSTVRVNLRALLKAGLVAHTQNGYTTPPATHRKIIKWFEK